MKIVVSYIVVVNTTLEVDDEFYKLTSDGGYDELSNEEENKLNDKLFDIIEMNCDAGYNDILSIETDDGEMLFEK